MAGSRVSVYYDNMLTKAISWGKTREDARKMLKSLSGKTHMIYSGVSIIDAKARKELLDYEITKVKFRKISGKEISKYVATGEPMDKAGSYAIQGLGATFVSKIDGCYSNVVGLPLFKLAESLKKFGVDIFEYEKWTNYVE